VDVTIQYVQMHYSLPLNVSLLAGMVHVSPAHLAHCFRKKTGTTVMRYVQQVRVDAATRLLATTSDPIANIARTVGFLDPLHFSRVFKKLTGCTPSMLRCSPVTNGAFGVVKLDDSCI
jgi:AraC-like DNA-binding protein